MTRLRLSVFIAAGLLVAFALAFFVSPEASSKPDGLNKVAIEEGFADQEEVHALEDAPTAGYTVEGVGNERLSTGLAGIIGVAVTFAAGAGLFFVVRRARRARSEPAAP
jgi:hypothetical protein